MIIRAFGKTDIGTHKTKNEDSFLYKNVKFMPSNEYAAILAVADGVGSMPKAEYASGIAIKRIEQWWQNVFVKRYEEGDIEAVIKDLIQKVENINYEIALYSSEQKCHMATTLSILIIYKDIYYILHIGDSQIKRVRNNVKQLTIDHTSINAIVKRSMLNEYLGGEREEFDYQLDSGRIKNNDLFIVGSDGIFKKLDDDDFMEELGQFKNGTITMETVVDNLIDLAKDRCEKDNITLLVASVVK